MTKSAIRKKKKYRHLITTLENRYSKVIFVNVLSLGALGTVSEPCKSLKDLNRVSAKYFFPISRFFSQFFGCFSRFFGKFFACFQGSSKKFHQICTYKFRNFRTNLNIRRFSDTKMGDLSRFDTAENFLCNKLSFQDFQGFPLKNTCFSRFSRPPGLISRFSRFSRSGSHPVET